MAKFAGGKSTVSKRRVGCRLYERRPPDAVPKLSVVAHRCFRSFASGLVVCWSRRVQAPAEDHEARSDERQEHRRDTCQYGYPHLLNELERTFDA